MKKIFVLALIIGFCFSLFVVPKISADQKKSQDVVIITRQKKSAFTAIVDDGQVCLKNWEINFYDSEKGENHTYRLVIGGKEKGSGKFGGFHHVVEKTVSKGHYSTVKVYLDGDLFSWEDISVMKKAPSEEKMKEAAKEKSVAFGIGQWLMQQLGLIVLGCIIGIGGIVTQRWFVQRKKESEVLEGL